MSHPDDTRTPIAGVELFARIGDLTTVTIEHLCEIVDVGGPARVVHRCGLPSVGEAPGYLGAVRAVIRSHVSAALATAGVWDDGRERILDRLEQDLERFAEATARAVLESATPANLEIEHDDAGAVISRLTWHGIPAEPLDPGAYALIPIPGLPAPTRKDPTE